MKREDGNGETGSTHSQECFLHTEVDAQHLEKVRSQTLIRCTDGGVDIGSWGRIGSEYEVMVALRRSLTVGTPAGIPFSRVCEQGTDRS